MGRKPWQPLSNEDLAEVFQLTDVRVICADVPKEHVEQFERLYETEVGPRPSKIGKFGGSYWPADSQGAWPASITIQDTFSNDIKAFIFAHELGHHQCEITRCPCKGYIEPEIHANTFSLEFLMKHELFMPLVEAMRHVNNQLYTGLVNPQKFDRLQVMVPVLQSQLWRDCFQICGPLLLSKMDTPKARSIVPLLEHYAELKCPTSSSPYPKTPLSSSQVHPPTSLPPTPVEKNS